MIDPAAELAALLRPVSSPFAELSAGGGNYLRLDGTWLYAATEKPVPGASDVTLHQRYAAAPHIIHAGHEYLLLDSTWLWGPDARRELSWCAPCVIQITGAHPSLTLAVPAPEFARRGDVVVGIAAPELDPADMLTASRIAELLGVARSTVNAYHARGQMPPPAVTLSRRLPLWPRPVIDHWMSRHVRRHR